MKIMLNHVSFAYKEAGSGFATLFLHGSRDRKEVFDSLIPFLKNDLRVLFMDLRSHGDSEVTQSGFSYEQFVDDIHQLIRGKKIQQLNLVGHSLGGVLTLLFSLQHPELIHKIVLLGTSASFVPKFKRPISGSVINAKIIEETNLQAMPFFFLPEFPHVQEFILAHWSRMHPSVHERLIKMGHFDCRSSLEKINVPTLIVCGEKDRICPIESGQLLHKQISGSVLKVIEGTGHFMFMEKPTEVARELLSFLKE